MFRPWVPKVIYTNKWSYTNLVYLGLFLMGFLKKRKRALKHAVQGNTSNLRKWKFSEGTLPKNPTESKVCQPEFTKEFRWPTLYNAWKSHLDFALQPGEIQHLYFFFRKKKKKWHYIFLDVVRQLEVLWVDARTVLLSTLVFCKSGAWGGRQS